jgi:hypothetical protein
MLFEDATLSDTALKLRRLIETTGADNSPYFEALGTVLAHELVRVHAGPRPSKLPRGWPGRLKQRVVTAYIEDHLPNRSRRRPRSWPASVRTTLLAFSNRSLAAASLSQSAAHGTRQAPLQPRLP